MKALIKVGYSCNDHCGFCHTEHVRHIDGEAAEISRKIHRAKELGHSMVVFSGGEPTIRPELPEWARQVAELDMDVGLVTNGRMLSYPEFTDGMLASRLKYVYLSLHGGTAKVHNLMVRSQAFTETFGAIPNLVGRGLDLTVNCVVTKHNVSHLRSLVDALAPYEGLRLKFSMVEPKGGAEDRFRFLMPKVSVVAEKVEDAIRYAKETGSTLQLLHGALPLCLVPDSEAHFDDLRTHAFRSMTEVGEADFYPVDDLNKVQPDETCRACPKAGPCPGLYQGYAEAFGTSELRPPAPVLRSNSFNYTFQSLIERFDGAAWAAGCPVLQEGVTAWDRSRDLLIRHGQGGAVRTGHYRTNTRDFSDREIELVKHLHGQVYVDVSRKTAPDNFAEDLAGLDRVAECETCPKREICSGVFEVRLENSFARDDERLRASLRELAGDVIDVGCGDSPYVDVFIPEGSRASGNYAGVDPDASKLSELSERLPEAELICCHAEELPSSVDGRFDHALVLRSWNHFKDPVRAVERLTSCLRPGGQLWIADNQAFGLARTARQSRKAEGSAAEHEHYRNDSAEDAARILARFPYTLLRREDAGKGSSNQWLLAYVLK